MNQYILDTDHLTLLQHSNPLILQRFETLHISDVAITVINVEELIQGWFNAIRQASQPGQKQRLTWAYVGLSSAVKFLNDFLVLDFTESACEQYLALRRQGIRIGTQDLRIASIALVNNSILVTRNRQDFAQVPGLVLEDWT
ncbi:type II toxin-antitoxin system VapC family toxin [Microcoleus sp. D2_18a_D3]|uniref:type II toxin-antitoxin system VapC family toxin n=1 Tax=Microcoleus sp. D2_18a_D3 TaxID=3055330 RepID=UPI002FD54C37